ncbi:hypothetical protein [Prevotella fusca]
MFSSGKAQDTPPACLLTGITGGRTKRASWQVLIQFPVSYPRYCHLSLSSTASLLHTPFPTKPFRNQHQNTQIPAIHR